jgi:Polyketide cyclase / dehydrase and lipid transport
MKWMWIVGGTLFALVAIVAIVGAMLPQSHRATRSARFRQKPEAVYAAIAGPSDWRSDVKASGTLPDGRWWEQDGHNNRVTFELVEDRPPSRRVTHIADKGLPFGGTWTLEIAPAPDGCTLRITEDGEIYNVIFRFVARFFMGYTGSMETYLRDLGRKFGETPAIEA